MRNINTHKHTPYKKAQDHSIISQLVDGYRYTVRPSMVEFRDMVHAHVGDLVNIAYPTVGEHKSYGYEPLCRYSLIQDMTLYMRAWKQVTPNKGK